MRSSFPLFLRVTPFDQGWRDVFFAQPTARRRFSGITSALYHGRRAESATANISPHLPHC